MVEMATVLAGLAIIIAMATLGAVLLIRFVMPGAARGNRILAAALLGSAAPLLPFTFVSGLGGDWIAATLGFGALIAGAGLLVGWPIAHFATRRLDRLTGIDARLFD